MPEMNYSWLNEQSCVISGWCCEWMWSKAAKHQ